MKEIINKENPWSYNSRLISSEIILKISHEGISYFVSIFKRFPGETILNVI